MNTTSIRERSPLPVFRDAESLVRYLEPERSGEDVDAQRELERIQAMTETREGQQELLGKIQRASGSRGGDVNHLYEHVRQNITQLHKKESFLKKVLKFPGRALAAIGRTITKYPKTSAVVGIAALIALLYFLPAPPGVGHFRDDMIDGVRRMLTRTGVGLPQAHTDSIAQVPVTGGPVAPAVIQRGQQILQSPGATQEHIDRLRQLLP